MPLETHEDAVQFVTQVFREMGGRVIPPNRPRRIDKYEIISPDRDAFMMDFENYCLEHCWDNAYRPHPRGIKRHEDCLWAAMIQSQLFPHHSDIDWNEYVDWVSRGFGDEWFQEETSPENARCMGCGRGDDFCRCGTEAIWWGHE